MANTRTPYGAYIDTGGTDFAIDAHVETIVFTETGGTASELVALFDAGATNRILRVNLRAGETVVVPFGGRRLDSVQASFTGSGTGEIHFVFRSRF